MHSPYGEFDSRQLQEAHMTDSTPRLPKPSVVSCEGRQSRSRILCVQGLCIAIVSDADRLQTAIDDLSEVMPRWHALSGSALVVSKTPLDLGEAVRLRWANQGISVQRATTNAEIKARGMLGSFLLSRQSSSIAHRFGESRL